MARTIHKVKRGEHLSAIAAQYGFRSFVPIWNADENSHLRKVREDPHQLLPGDEVVIIEPKPIRFTRETGASYTFVVQVEKLKLRACVYDRRRKPIANAGGTLTVDGAAIPVTTDDKGFFEARVNSKARAATLEIGGLIFQLGIGELQPASEPVGQFGRFENLDLWFDKNDEALADLEDARQLATELMDALEKKASDGTLDADHVAHLAKMHDEDT